MSSAGNWFRHLGHQVKRQANRVGDVFNKTAALGLPSLDPATQAGKTAKQGLSNRLPVESDAANPKDARPADGSHS